MGDGSPVEVYARLPARDVPDFVATFLPPGGSLLDLGAGVGRYADPLADRGFAVTAVDTNPAMLARVRRARTVLASIEELRLGERFDLVLLASHLVNTTDPLQRSAFLTTVAAHGGAGLVEWYEPSWFDAPAASGRIGAVAVSLEVLALAAGRLDAVVRYEVDGRSFEQRFAAQRLEFDDLKEQAAAQGLSLTRTDRPKWLRLDPSA